MKIQHQFNQFGWSVKENRLTRKEGEPVAEPTAEPVPPLRGNRIMLTSELRDAYESALESSRQDRLNREATLLLEEAFGDSKANFVNIQTKYDADIPLVGLDREQMAYGIVTAILHKITNTNLEASREALAYAKEHAGEPHEHEKEGGIAIRAEAGWINKFRFGENTGRLKAAFDRADEGEQQEVLNRQALALIQEIFGDSDASYANAQKRYNVAVAGTGLTTEVYAYAIATAILYRITGDNLDMTRAAIAYAKSKLQETPTAPKATVASIETPDF